MLTVHNVSITLNYIESHLEHLTYSNLRRIVNNKYKYFTEKSYTKLIN